MDYEFLKLVKLVLSILSGRKSIADLDSLDLYNLGLIKYDNWWTHKGNEFVDKQDLVMEVCENVVFEVINNLDDRLTALEND